MSKTLNKISDFYSDVLLNTPLGDEALKYLVSRGFSTETITDFGVGFSPDFRVDYIKEKILNYTDISTLEEIGHLEESKTKGRYIDRFQGRITFPLKDANGTVLGFAARRPDGAIPKYINSADSDIYHKSRCLYGFSLAPESIYDNNYAILCEGYTDAMAFHQIGKPQSVACGGTYATDHQLALIARYTKNLVLAFDADDAGDDVTSRTVDMAKSMGFKIKQLTFERGKDPAEVLLNKSKI